MSLSLDLFWDYGKWYSDCSSLVTCLERVMSALLKVQEWEMADRREKTLLTISLWIYLCELVYFICYSIGKLEV